MQRLFARYPEALACTVEIVDRCRLSSTRASRSGRNALIPVHPAADAGESDLHAAWRYPRAAG